MTIHDVTLPAPPAAAEGAPTEVYLQVGTIARLLHDALAQLGVMPALKRGAEGLPEARSRLGYVADKSGNAAERVLEAVEQAKAEQATVAARARALAAALTADPVKAVASGAVLNFVGDVDDATARIDRHLTDIMLAQDFHDLTGQVVARVVALAADLEASLVRLLMQVAPLELGPRPDAGDAAAAARGADGRPALAGPVIGAAGRSDVVSSQHEVDELLASLGF